MDLARRHGLTAQAVRNYERNGVIPAARRTGSGYRVYTELHVVALSAYLALVQGYGYRTAAVIMRAAGRGDVESALTALDGAHGLLQRDRETLATVASAATVLASAPPSRPGDRPLPVGAVAHRLDVTPATLRKWEQAGILVPARDRYTHHRMYTPDDVRDAELTHLLRRGGYRLDHIATVVAQVRSAGGPEALAGSLAGWQERLTARGRAMLTGSARLDEYLTLLEKDLLEESPLEESPLEKDVAPPVGGTGGAAGL
ncbi:TioE family transcriptional regulator [Actinoplanes sp. GCM10030250]|uniref:TioE family transcriptional regulator n=1 Tax=Actinoplanes sp. GCM10030250 TaxID=3273376 RepID=UPI003614D23B